MAKMKAVQVTKAGADFEIVEREIPQPDATREDPSASLWNLPQRRNLERRTFLRHNVPTRPRTRSSRRDRRTGRGREGMAERPTGWSWLARWARRHVSYLPTRRFRELRKREDL